MIFIAPDEKIIRIVRKHWFILLVETVAYHIFFFIPFAIYFGVLSGSIPEQYIASILALTSPSFLIFLASVWTLVIWMKLSAIWADYYLDTWIITDRRIVDIEQFGFFKRSVSSFRMERIQDVSIDVHGLIPTLLNFGDIHVQTAGEAREFVMKGIGAPSEIKNLIREQSDMHVSTNL
ncbi:MAG: PH domain-containing protein [Candidatus Paceibacterota bacterium]